VRLGLGGGRDQRAEPAALVFRRVVAPDVVIRSRKLGADGRELDTPAAPATVPAINRREPHIVVVRGTGSGAVVGPRETRQRGRGAIDAGELADPEMDIDGERAAPDAGAHVAERPEHAREKEASLVA